MDRLARPLSRGCPGGAFRSTGAASQDNGIGP